MLASETKIQIQMKNVINLLYLQQNTNNTFLFLFEQFCLKILHFNREA